MKFNIVLIQPANYPHSYSVLEICQLLHFSLIDLGHTSTLTRNYFESGAINIVFCGHLLPNDASTQIPAATIFFNSEQLPRNGLGWVSTIFNQASKFKMFDYSSENALELTKRLNYDVPVLKIGFHAGLRRIMFNQDKDIDVLFYGSLNSRRKNCLESLIKSGLTVKTLFGVYGAERDEWVARSKLVLNLHYYEAKILEVVRIFYLLTNSVPVVTEVSAETKVEGDILDFVASSDYGQLEERCLELCQFPEKAMQIGSRGYEGFCKRNQRDFTEELVDQLLF